MNNKTCGECRYFKQKEDICSHNQKHYWSKAEFEACTGFEPKVITNGDKIRQMRNAKLADTIEELAFRFCSRRDFINWLNAPAESEGKR